VLLTPTPTVQVVFVTPSAATSAGGARTPTASPKSGIGAGLPCSATAENKDFFAAAAGAMPWDVYCAVLPARWRVGGGGGVYSADHGGMLGISYEGPDGGMLSLNEGAYCTTGAADCSPRGAVIGPAAFGDRVGTLYEYKDGYVLYVNPGTSRAYALIGSGLDEASFRSIGSALYKVPNH
jgi:hypothetical protein